MSWLAGKRILMTRASGQMEGIAKHIRQRGGVPIAFPCLAVICLADPVREAVKLFEDDGVQAVFTSANGVHCAASILGGKFVPAFQSIPVVAVGHRTADALETAGIKVAWTPQTASQEGLMNAYRQRNLPKRLVFFRAEQGRNILSAAMEEAGVDVHLIPVYRTVCPDDDARSVIQSLKNDTIDAVLLGSVRTTMHYMRRISNSALANRPVIAVISPRVADAARALNLDVQVVAKEASFAFMLDELEAWFQK